LEDGLTLPGEIALYRDRIEQLRIARMVLEQRATERAPAERAEYEAKRTERVAKQQRGERVGGHEPQPPLETPQTTDQYNFTDPESRIMKAGNGPHFEQAYNAQVAVDADSRLIVGQRVTNAPTAKQQLRSTVATIPAAVAATVREVLADNGFVSQAEISELEHDGQLTV